MFRNILALIRRHHIPVDRLETFGTRLQYTTDAPLLETTSPWLVFVYDGFMKYHRQHSKLLDMGAKYPSRRLGNGMHADPIYGYTTGDYVLWKHRDGPRSFPIPLDHPMKLFQNRPVWDLTGGQAFKVRGEIYELPWEGIIKLDSFYQNGVAFERRRVGIMQAYHYELKDVDGRVSLSLRHETINSCWMYVGIQKYWDKILDGTYEPVHVFPRKGGVPPFYYFTHHEYRSEGYRESYRRASHTL
jgi:hypothetical protein